VSLHHEPPVAPGDQGPSADPGWAARVVRIAWSLLAVGVLISYSGVHGWPALALLGVGALMLWWLSLPVTVLGYVATLGVQVWVLVGRIALADLFLVPAAVRMAISIRDPRALVRSSSFQWPFLLLLVSLTLGTIVGAVRIGQVVPYVIVNKDVGVVYLIIGFFTITEYTRDRAAFERLIRWFVVGVSFANIVSLLGMMLVFVGLQNELYLTGNMRLYGSMLSPNRFGGILLMVAMIELGALAAGVVMPLWRRANLWAFALSLALTLSRGSWLAAGAGAAALLALQVAGRADRPVARSVRVIALWLLIPIAALTGLSRVSSMSFEYTNSADHADRLRQRFIDTCRASPALAICASVQMPREAPIDTNGALRGTPSDQLPELLPDPAGRRAEKANAARSLTNTRGVEDRLAILAVGARGYTENWRTMLLGTGVDTFYATSAAAFGIPLVIHNTFAWFLFEMGPVGLAAVSWIWVTTARNLWRAHCALDWRRTPAPGLIAAFVGMTVFCLLNEGFYQRHLWLLFALADRLGRSVSSQPVAA